MTKAEREALKAEFITGDYRTIKEFAEEKGIAYTGNFRNNVARENWWKDKQAHAKRVQSTIVAKAEAQRVFDEAKQLGIDTKGIDNLDVIKAKVEEKKRLQSDSGSGIISLSKQEWAQYYKIIGDEQHGDFVYHNQYGGRAVRLENKIVFDDGNFENPTVKDTYQFASNEEMNYAFAYWARKGVLR